MTGAPHSSVKRYRELARNSSTNGLERELLLDGSHLLFEAQKSRLPIDSAAFEQAALDDPSIKQLAEQLVASGTDVFIVSRKTLESMSPVKSPSGVVGIARRTLPSLADALTSNDALVVVGHDVQDPGNVGGIMRTAEAAGATAFIATSSTADPLGWKALRGSMGSGLRLPIARAEIGDVLRALKDAGITTNALVPRDGQALFATDLRKSSALILGSEGAGVPDAIMRQVDRRITIPMQQPVESLNVGVAAALVLYEAFRQRTLSR
ncbi:MAG TPA: RNA methyltransferase [Vicinamibacterales bacterium]|nr:RNA methyltransferase [Vicinamibacterales bacterium]